MSFNGSGTFSINSTGQPVVTGTVISSTVFNAFTADIATGLSNTVCKDGQQTLTANIPMAGFKLTGLGAGSATGNSVRYEQFFPTFNTTGPINETKTTVVSATTPDIWTLIGNVVDYTGTNTATGFAAAPQAGSQRKLVCAAAAVFTAGANVLIQGVPSGANYTAVAGDIIEVTAITTTQFRLVIYPVTGVPGKQATRQVLLTGSSATYTTPSGATRLFIRMVGGGAAGGGASAGAVTAGGNGTDTTFNSITATGGTGGATSATSNGGAGGTGGAGSASVRMPGQAGGRGKSGGTVVSFNAAGGSSLLGNGRAILPQTGTVSGSAGNLYGGGGTGAAGDLSTYDGSGGGGGGEYAEIIITAPAVTYTYTVGTAGAAGTGSVNGGGGSAGVIIVDEFYN